MGQGEGTNKSSSSSSSPSSPSSHVVHSHDLPEMTYSYLVSWWHVVPKLGGWGRHNWKPFSKMLSAMYSEWSHTQHSPCVTHCPWHGAQGMWSFEMGTKPAGSLCTITSPTSTLSEAVEFSRILFPAFFSPWLLIPGISRHLKTWIVMLSMALELGLLVFLQENFRFFSLTTSGSLRLCHKDKRREESRKATIRDTGWLHDWLK